MSEPIGIGRRCLAEGLGTGFLVATVVGSGIAAQRYSPTDHGLQLLENALATGGVLVALILALASVSASFNPVITAIARYEGRLSTVEAVGAIVAQLIGACAGTVIANLMFALPAVQASRHHRSSGALWLSEAVATFGLVLIVMGLERTGRLAAAPYAVGGYIFAAYWFTSSTSFANPAVTIARMLTNTFSGIAPSSAPMFVLMQCAGGGLALLAGVVLFPVAA